MKKSKEELLNALPAEWPEDLLPAIQEQVKKTGQKVVVLDDDPTGTQTVHDVTVLTTWPEEALVQALQEDEPVVYILTNSRSLPLSEAQAMNREISSHLARAREIAGRDFVLASRSDSTLRGHFPEEVHALLSGTGGAFDGILVIPFFLEGGRYTIEDIHYVAEGDWLVPAAETEYARDATFGYRSSNLRKWVSEKYKGEIQPEQVLSISIHDLRTGGPPLVAQCLKGMQGGQVCVVNAASYRDVEVLVAGLLEAEAAGRRLIYRTAASFVRVRGGLEPHGLLTPAELLALTGRGPGLIIAGSYIQKSSQQIEAVIALPGVKSLEVNVEALLDETHGAQEILQVTRQADQVIAKGENVLIYTSRRLVLGNHPDQSLQIGQTISTGLVEIVRGLSSRPAWVIAKGGITSSDIATRSLDVQRARVLGQAIPGSPVWQTGPESRWPGLIYVVFPGNVGGPDSLAWTVKLLSQPG
jgi:uncharacterized protein YgbK (DUF1537 family)